MSNLSKELQAAVNRRVRDERIRIKFRDGLPPMERIIFELIEMRRNMHESLDPEDIGYLDTWACIDEIDTELRAVLA